MRSDHGFSVLTGSEVQNALEWLEKHQDQALEEISNTESSEKLQEEDDDGPALKPGEQAQSLQCQDCGKRLRSTAQAEFHAAKTQHINFAESTEEIAPLTEEEKKAKLEELRQKLAEKRAGTSTQDKIDQKRNEVIVLASLTLIQSAKIHCRKSDEKARSRRKTSRKTFKRKSRSRKRPRNAKRSRMT